MQATFAEVRQKWKELILYLALRKHIAVATRCSVLKFTRRSFHKLYSKSQGQIQDEFFPLLSNFCERCLHSTADVDTIDIEPVKEIEIKSDGILHNVTYHISLRARVGKCAVDLYLVLVDSCSIIIGVFIKII